MKKRILSALLAIVMVVYMLPMSTIVANAEIAGSDGGYYWLNPSQSPTPGRRFIKEIAMGAYDPDIFDKLNGTGANSARLALLEMLDDSSYNTYGILEHDLNEDAGGDYIYIGWNNTTNPTEAITGLQIRIFEDIDEDEGPPRSYQNSGVMWYLANSGCHEWAPKLNTDQSEDGYLDLNDGAGGDYVYLYVTKDPSYGPPISSIGAYGYPNSFSQSRQSELVYDDKGNPADCNSGTDDDPIYLSVRTEFLAVDIKSMKNMMAVAKTFLDTENANSKYALGGLEFTYQEADEMLDNWRGGLFVSGDDRYSYSSTVQNVVLIEALNRSLNKLLEEIDAIVYFNAEINGGKTDKEYQIYRVDETVNDGIYPSVADKVDVDLSTVSASRSGYQFLGWNTNKNATTGHTSGVFEVAPGTTYYAIFKKDVSTVFHFLAEDGTAKSQTANSSIYNQKTESTYTVPSVPTTVEYTNGTYTFKGWRDDVSVGSAEYGTGKTIGVYYMLTNLYAVYARQVVLNFETGNGDNIDSVSVDCYLNASGKVGSAAYTLTKEPAAPEGKIFSGWAITEGSTDVAYRTGDTLTLDADMTLYAVWEDEIIHIHSWADEYSHDETAHWHECTANDCTIVNNSEKDAYGQHTAEADDGSCLTKIKCSECGYVITPAAMEHSFTNKSSQTLASAADCQHKAKYYVQCDNCNVVSDTLTVEVGERGDHNFDTEWSKDTNNHWHKCLTTGCSVIKDENEHFSTGDNVATYTKKAVCDACGAEYGDVVTDNENPTGTITVYGNTWREFVNTITFGIFCKDTQTVAITTSDVGLGVEKAEYIFTETDYASADTVLQDTDISWKALILDDDGNASFNIAPNEKGIVYLKITDKAGNVTVIRSDKIMLDNIVPIIKGIEDGKTYCGSVKFAVVEENIKSVTVDAKELVGTDEEFLVEPKQEKQEIKVEDKAGNVVTYHITVNDGHSFVYETNGIELIEKCMDCDHEAKAFIGIVGMTENNAAKVYDGQAVEATIRYEGEFLGKDKLTVKYTCNGSELAATPADAGQYSVELYMDGAASPASYLFSILQKPVELPEINTKVYTGETLTADIQNTELYTVTANIGGINTGWYDVNLTLKDAANYMWDGSDGATATLKFEITKATNEWVGEPEIMGWGYGEGMNAPVAAAKFGTVEYTYCDAEGNGLTDEPKDAGDYTVRVFVTGTENYTGITKELKFTIGKRLLSVKWTAPDSLVYDGTAKLPDAEHDQGAVAGDEPQIITELTEGCDNVNAGTFTFTATGVSSPNYELTGNVVSPVYTISPKTVTLVIEIADADNYDGTEKKPAVTVKDGDTVLPASEYTVVYTDNINAGTGTVTVIDKDGGNYKVSGKTDFVIEKANPTVAWPENLAGKQGDKLSTVVLPEGFAWENAAEEIRYGEGNTYAMTYTPADTANHNVMHKDITVNGADVTTPTAVISLGTNAWNSFLHNITFGLFFKETQTLSITANDTESGVKEIAYHLANTEMSTEDVKALATGQWRLYTGKITVEPSNKYVVYVRIMDNAGNIAYINSDGLTLDSTIPVISGIENGGEIYSDAVFTVEEEDLASVTVDGVTVDVVDGKYTITADNAEHTVVVTDKFGNSTEYKVTVYKTYTVTFMANGKEVTKQVVGYGKDVELPEIPAKEGYTAKWNVDGKNITAETTITAEYTENPKIDSPQTGDNSNMALWLALLFISSLGIAETTVLSRKKRIN